MPLFGSGTGCPLPNPLSPIHADPVARAIGPGANRNRPHRGQLGWPQIRRLRTIAPLPAEGLRLQRARLPRRLAPCAPEGLPDTLQRVSVSDGCPSARSDPTPSQLPAPDADSPLNRTTFVARNPVVLFKGQYAPSLGGRNYDVSPDGRRFLMLKVASSADAQNIPSARFIVVENWFEDLKRLVPTN